MSTTAIPEVLAVCCGTCRHQWEAREFAGVTHDLVCPACGLAAGATRVDNAGTIWWLSGHARRRYAQRVPGGPGLAQELAGLRVASRKEKARIRRSCPVGSQRYRGAKVYWVNAVEHTQLVIVALVWGKAEYLVLTVWLLEDDSARRTTPWTIVEPTRPETMPPDLVDVIVAYPPDDGIDEPFIMQAYYRGGTWILVGDSEPIGAYQNPLCWMRTGDLPALPLPACTDVRPVQP